MHGLIWTLVGNKYVIKISSSKGVWKLKFFLPYRPHLNWTVISPGCRFCRLHSVAYAIFWKSLSKPGGARCVVVIFIGTSVGFFYNCICIFVHVILFEYFCCFSDYFFMKDEMLANSFISSYFVERNWWYWKLRMTSVGYLWIVYALFWIIFTSRFGRLNGFYNRDREHFRLHDFQI